MAPMSSATRRLSLQPLGDVAGHDALGQALDDGGLADAGLADQHGVVLGAAREHLDDAADLLVAADDRIELALARDLGQVARVALRAPGTCPRGSGRSRAGCRARRRARGRCASGVTPAAARTRGGAAGLLLGDGDQQVLGRDVLVLEPLGLVLRAIDHALEALARRTVRPPPRTFGSFAISACTWRRHRLRRARRAWRAAGPPRPPAAGAAPAAGARARSPGGRAGRRATGRPAPLPAPSRSACRVSSRSSPCAAVCLSSVEELLLSRAEPGRHRRSAPSRTGHRRRRP